MMLDMHPKEYLANFPVVDSTLRAAPMYKATGAGWHVALKDKLPPDVWD
jgi:hypothetical protein